MRNEQNNQPPNQAGNINIRSNPIPSSPSANKKQIMEQALDNQGDNQQFNCRFNPPSGQPPPVITFSIIKQ